MKNLFDSLNSLPYFTRSDFHIHNLKPKQVEMFIYRACKSGELIRLKNGIYTTAKYINEIRIAQELNAYQEFLANHLVPESYISSSYVLSKYELLTEAVSAITSFTKRRSAIVTNLLGNFNYQHVESSQFGNFEMIKSGNFLIKITNKISALIDYLLLAQRQLKAVNEQTVLDLRVNYYLLSKGEKAELKKNIEHIKSKKLEKIINIMDAYYAA